jgi:hypothetical protein
MELSVDYDIPLVADAVSIRREERHVFVEGKYTKQIEVAPNVPYEWPFTWSIDAMTSTMVPTAPPEK